MLTGGLNPIGAVDVSWTSLRRIVSCSAKGGNVFAGSSLNVAASPIVTVTPRDSLLYAALLMREHSTAHVIVVADESSPLPIGVLSMLDVARAFAAVTAPEE